ncbi:hypothetical protein KUTeg_015392, partial [Tegillarca granosa]
MQNHEYRIGKLHLSKESSVHAPIQQKKVAFFVGMGNNYGPIKQDETLVFDKVVTNIGGAFDDKTGIFTAPHNGTYEFTIVVSAQGRQKAAAMLMKGRQMIFTVWAESIPFWATATNRAILNLQQDDQIRVVLMSQASFLYGYMYSTFSGYMLFEDSSGDICRIKLQVISLEFDQ